MYTSVSSFLYSVFVDYSSPADLIFSNLPLSLSPPSPSFFTLSLSLPLSLSPPPPPLPLACDKACLSSCEGPGADSCDECAGGYQESEEGECLGE